MRMDALVSRPWGPVFFLLVLVIPLLAAPRARGQAAPTGPAAAPSANIASADAAGGDAPKSGRSCGRPLNSPVRLPDLTKRENFSGAMQLVILLTVLSLAPAILIMMTSSPASSS